MPGTMGSSNGLPAISVRDCLSREFMGDKEEVLLLLFDPVLLSGSIDHRSALCDDALL
jgi:hypothetical protein